MDQINSHPFETGPQELAASLLNQVERDLRRFHGATTRIERELYFDAYSWIMSDDLSWPFSFLNVCQLLNLIPEDFRQELLDDLSFGPFRSRARRFKRMANRFQTLLSQPFAREHNPTATYAS